MSRVRTALATLALTAAGALLGAQAAEATQVFVAYGEGLTRCTIKVKKRGMKPGMGGVRETEFEGRTDCSVPIEQSGHAIVPKGSESYDLDGGLCEGLRATCVSGGYQRNQGTWSADMIYTVKLRAPLGQGWLGAPEPCTGVGTDNLQCTFTAGNSFYYLWL